MASTSGVGLVYTASQAKNQLYEQNRDYNNQLTWKNLYDYNDATAAQAQQSLVNSYTDASVEAYISHLQGQQAIRNSSIVGGGRNEAMDYYTSALNDAMSSYRSSLASSQSSIESSRQENEATIDQLLDEQAESTSAYTNAHYEYLQYLYDEYLEGNNKLFDSADWKKYLTYDYQYDNEGNVVYDDYGNVVYDEESPQLMTYDQLASAKDLNGEYESLFDENGNLTMYGTNFFDQMENSGVGWDENNRSETWGTWLNENYEELYDWANSYNYYNYTQEGSNAGTLRTMYGMMSDDYTYSFVERFGGLSSSTIDSYFDKFAEAVDENFNKEYKSKKKATKAANQLTDVFGDLLTELDLMPILEAEGTSWDDLKNTINDELDQMVTNGAMVGEGLGSIGMGAATGASVGVAGGPFGAILGAICGALLGAGATAVEIYSSEMSNMEISKAIKETYDQFVVNLSEIKNQIYSNRNVNQLIY